VISFLTWVGYRVFVNALEMGREASCSSGLSGARMSIEAYREKHGGRLPERFDQLNLNSPDPDAFRCPKARGAGKRAYLFIPVRDDAPEDTPILICWRHPHLLMLTKSGSVQAR
jgi:hypothetical protein